MREYVVACSENGLRLDKFLSLKIPDKSRTKIQSAIEDTLVHVDNKVITNVSEKLKLGQTVRFFDELIEVPQTDLKPEKVDFEVLFEDDDLIVLDKPSGVVVHPGNGNWSGTLVNGLLEYSKNLSSGSDQNRPGIVHRIDKDTSGILVVAKNDNTHFHLAQQFAVHSITRKYVCYTYGVPNLNSPLVSRLDSEKFLIQSFIGRDPISRKKMKILQSGGKNAVSIFKILENFRVFKNGIFASKIECELRTGRTHQVRVHMSFLGSPLIGDQTYGKHKKLPIRDSEYAYNFPRQALHAFYLKFRHPRTGGLLEFTSPIPADMQNLDSKLREI